MLVKAPGTAIATTGQGNRTTFSSTYARIASPSATTKALVMATTTMLALPLKPVPYVEDGGIEPPTLGLQSRCSPAELIPREDSGSATGAGSSSERSTGVVGRV